MSVFSNENPSLAFKSGRHVTKELCKTRDRGDIILSEFFFFFFFELTPAVQLYGLLTAQGNERRGA